MRAEEEERRRGGEGRKAPSRSDLPLVESDSESTQSVINWKGALPREREREREMQKIPIAIAGGLKRFYGYGNKSDWHLACNARRANFLAKHENSTIR